MAKRVLCEIVKEEFTGIEYPAPWQGNCFYSEDSAELRKFKEETLASHPELKGRLKVVSVAAMDRKRKAAYAARERSPAYQEWKAYRSSCGGGWM